jgi:hypothetical protein
MVVVVAVVIVLVVEVVVVVVLVVAVAVVTSVQFPDSTRAGGPLRTCRAQPVYPLGPSVHVIAPDMQILSVIPRPTLRAYRQNIMP